MVLIASIRNNNTANEYVKHIYIYNKNKIQQKQQQQEQNDRQAERVRDLHDTDWFRIYFTYLAA